MVSDAKWHKAGDLRATVTPFLANMTIGPDNFKWMLFGDDDTVFLIDNVLNLLPHLDPAVPYFMTDHLWYPETVGKQSLGIAPQTHLHCSQTALAVLPCRPRHNIWVCCKHLVHEAWSIHCCHAPSIRLLWSMQHNLLSCITHQQLSVTMAAYLSMQQAWPLQSTACPTWHCCIHLSQLTGTICFLCKA